LFFPELIYLGSGPVLWAEMRFKLKNGYICNPLEGLAELDLPSTANRQPSTKLVR
jgi:hypothetical protein